MTAASLQRHGRVVPGKERPGSDNGVAHPRAWIRPCPKTCREHRVATRMNTCPVGRAEGGIGSSKADARRPQIQNAVTRIPNYKCPSCATTRRGAWSLPHGSAELPGFFGSVPWLRLGEERDSRKTQFPEVVGGIVDNLSITLSNGQTLTHTLPGCGTEVIGRDPACDIWVDDPSTSRRHAQFRKTPEGYVVEDLGSKNGTLVNDVLKASHLLRDNDIIILGMVRIRFIAATDAPEQVTVVVTDQPSARESARFSNRGVHVQLSQQRLQMIYDLSDRLTRLRDRDKLLSDAMDICFDTLRCERGAIAIRRHNSRAIDWPVVRHLRGKEGELTISRTTLSRALDHGERAVVTEDTLGDADPTVSMVQHGIRSAMCVPLLYNEEILGVIYGDRISTAAVYTPEDVDFLAAIARQVSIGLINSRLLDEQRLKDRLEKDIALARQIQTGLLPQTLPKRPDITVAALNEPGNRVSGDYYDVIELPDGRVWILIADVTGEGVAASLLTANLQAAVRVTIDTSEDPGTLMTRWNRLICRNTDSSKFITVLLGLIDPTAGRAVFSGAGHLPPLLVYPGGPPPKAIDLKPDFPLGVVDGAQYESTVVELGSLPCTIYCYTDGVIEALNPGNELFGEHRLVDLLSSHSALGPARLLSNIRRGVTKFTDGAPQSDDITMLAVTLGGGS